MIQMSRKGTGEVPTLAFGAVVVVGLFAVAASTVVAQSSGTWALTGSLNTARAAHTATLLPNGQVLVAGGENTTGILARAELYNPSTGKWTETGSMSTPRINHQATLLANGQVLVSGGHSSTGALESAELFNPSTGQWTTTGSMTVPRTGHSALQLENGQVLVVAGDNTGTDSSAELYTPATGTWRATTSMQSPRSFTLVPLPDGRALAVDDSGTVNQESEIYNPSTAQWTLTGIMYYAHEGDAVLLPNGNALAYGNHFACYGGQFFNPSTNTWSRTQFQCGTGISFGPLALLATGKALLAGGVIVYSGRETSVTKADLYDFSSNAWAGTGALNQARDGHTLTRLLSGQVLAAGGGVVLGPGPPKTFLTSAELYAP
jgi:N-acetylneuraminic acid mutarotase